MRHASSRSGQAMQFCHSLFSKSTFGKGSQSGGEPTPVAWQVAALCRKLGIVQPQDMQLTMDAWGALDSLYSQV